MTNRAEIERLLNQTGRTLEGLPEFYPEEQAHALYCEVVGKKELLENRVLHQSDVIDLLVGALRDALDKKPKRKNVKFAPCTCGYNTHSEWYNCENHVWSYECNKCGRKSDKYAAKTKIEARIGWNKIIEELKVGEVHD